MKINNKIAMPYPNYYMNTKLSYEMIPIDKSVLGIDNHSLIAVKEYVN